MTRTRTRVPAPAALLSALALVAVSACGQGADDHATVTGASSVSAGHSALREANEHQARRQLAELRQQREQYAGNVNEHLGHRR